MIAEFSKSDVGLLKSSFFSAKPFRHVLVKGLLQDHARIFSALKSEEFIPKDADLFTFKQTRNLLYKPSKGLKPLVDYLCSSSFSEFVGSITGIRLSQGSLDLSGALYEQSDYLLCHDDDLEGRKVAFIIYFSESFTRKDGGALALYSDKNGHPFKKEKAYIPLKNSMIVFEVSKKSWHEIEEVVSNRQRFTIGGWLH